MRHPVLAVFIVLSLASVPALAADPPTVPASQAEITVTASAIEEPVEEVPVSVEVITREEIEQKQATDVAELLRSVPGIIVARAGSVGKQASLFMRGASSTQTLVLWNGIEINDPYFSGFDWGRFPTDAVERIEVVRGPFSSLYGADAIGGVINIISREPADEIFGAVSLGQNDYGHFRAGFSSVGDISTLVIAEARSDEGFHANDDFEQLAFTGTFRFDPRPSFGAGLELRFDDYDLGIPFNLGIPSPSRRQDGKEWQIALPIEGLWRGGAWDMNLSRTEHQLAFDDPDGLFGPETGRTRSITDRINASATIPTLFGTTIVGAEREEAVVEDESFGFTNLDSEERHLSAVFAEQRMTAPFDRVRFDLIVGLRYDDYRQFGSETSPRLSASAIVGPHRLRAAWGEAFRAPSVGDLYYPFYGNPDVRPETMEGTEVGYDRSFERGRVSLSWFDNDYENLIVFDNATGRAENIGLASSRGIELGTQIRLRESITAAFAWTWLETEDEVAGRELLRRPRDSGALDLAWSGSAWRASLSTIYNGDRLDVEAGFPFGTVPAEEWIRSDVSVSRRFGSFTPWIRIDNLFDEQYQETLGFPSPGRRVIGGVRYSRSGKF